jgi:hypothetical protein
MLPNKYAILWDNMPVGLDSDSGGYPYKTSLPSQVKYWETKEEAQKYIDIMQRGSSYGFNNVKIVEIQFRIMDKE